ncbi:hypothetical protein [Aquicella lusitana]|uniref:hypothetical protein n=1 Tax=Aquicella lusitana TaxID=254246 RepID=UPI0011C058FA|nr:hypothetical protein [Aquicella lusitana]
MRCRDEWALIHHPALSSAFPLPSRTSPLFYPALPRSSIPHFPALLSRTSPLFYPALPALSSRTARSVIPHLLRDPVSKK